MNTILKEVWHLLPSTLTQELTELSEQTGQPIEPLLADLFDASSHSLASISRMSPRRRREWLSSPETLHELTRLCWRAHWVEPTSAMSA